MNIQEAINTIEDFDPIASRARITAEANTRADQARLRLTPIIEFLSVQQKQKVLEASAVLVAQKAVQELINLLITKSGRLGGGPLSREVAVTTLEQLQGSSADALPALIQVFAQSKSSLLRNQTSSAINIITTQIDAVPILSNQSLTTLVQILVSRGDTPEEVKFQSLELISLFSLENISIDGINSIQDLVKSYGRPQELAESCSYHQNYVQIFSAPQAIKLLSFIVDYGDNNDRINTAKILGQVMKDYDSNADPENPEVLNGIENAKKDIRKLLDSALEKLLESNNYEKMSQPMKEEVKSFSTRLEKKNYYYEQSCQESQKRDPIKVQRNFWYWYCIYFSRSGKTYCYRRYKT